MRFPRQCEDDAAELRSRLDLVSRTYRLRQAGRIPPIWIDAWSIRVRPEIFGPRVKISWDELAALVSAAECERKPAAGGSAGKAFAVAV